MTMILATSYPFLEVFWTMLIFFALVALLYLVFIVFADIFRRHDESGGSRSYGSSLSSWSHGSAFLST
jgi:hypothetical protein